MTSIGDQVRSARVSQGWTQHDLAEHASLSRPTIARIERGDDVSTATLAKVAASLGLAASVAPESATYHRRPSRPGGDGGTSSARQSASAHVSAGEASLDLIWLRDESLDDAENLPAPEVIAREIVEELEAALTQFDEIAVILGAEGEGLYEPTAPAAELSVASEAR